MKGIILAGGYGTRLYPTTKVINKHLIPIYNKPMVYYPLSVLMLCGIRDVLIVTNPDDMSAFEKLLGDGSHLGISVSYTSQNEPKGLAHGLLMGEEFASGDSVCLILGDNIFYGHGLPELLRGARKLVEEKGGACVFGYYVKDPERFGVVEFDRSGKAVSLEEKPSNPRSNYAVVGLYFYDSTVFERAKKISPSSRGELEITSVNQSYLDDGRLEVRILGRGYAWFDAGTYDSFLKAGEFVATIERRTGLMIACLEEIAFNNGWIDEVQLKKLADSLKNTEYGHYLYKLLGEEAVGKL